MKLWNYIKKKMLKKPEQIICEGDEKMSYKDLIEFAENFSEDIRGEKCCLIMCDSELASARALLACFAAEVTAVPVSVRYGYKHCEKILDMISPTAIITDDRGEVKVEKMYNSSYREPVCSPALIMCTSGTTGIPKGAMLTEDNILANLKDISSYFDIDDTDYMLIVRSLHHCAVLTGEFLLGVTKGAKIQFYSREFNPKVVMDIINRCAITVYGGTPTQLSILSRYNHKYSGCILRTLCISGECMSKETAEKIMAGFMSVCNIYHVYGLTEASPRISYLPPEMFYKYPDCVGIPLESVKIKILNAEGKETAIGEEGILWVKGDNIMAGYYNSPKETERVLRDGWLCTKDIAVITPEGLLKIKGRSDDLIIRAGMNIYPAEIENTLKRDGRVREALVYKVETTHMGTQIGLKIVGDFRSIDEVKQLCGKLLPKYQMPMVMEILDELPKNGSGKVIRKDGII